ncbi:Gar1/Naf1 family protein [Geoglobus acetivorans]|uniref:Gar1/Naf1 family protein n=1 Tax=Geoglobus acetivorans TaxID=565033 RepID=A0ABZ3H4C2_GEOAI
MLKKIGRVLHISKTGNVILSSVPDYLPKEGSPVYNKRMEKIGFVYDIIGPVRNPFLVVKPFKRRIIEEDILFTVVEDGRGRKGKGKGNRKEGKRKGTGKKGSRKRRNN